MKLTQDELFSIFKSEFLRFYIHVNLLVTTLIFISIEFDVIKQKIIGKSKISFLNYILSSNRGIL